MRALRWARACGLAVVLAAAAPAAAAGELIVTVEPAATRVAFALRATLHGVEGRIPLESGEIRFDPTTGRASGKLVFAAAKATTDNEKRDRKMHVEVLESAKYPEAVFVPERIEGLFNNTGLSKLALIGSLTIHGASHPLTVPLDVRAAGSTVTVKGSFVIPYVAWGMKDPSAFLLRVAKEVEVMVESTGALAPAP
ncbi:MAG: YceI family protein [Acidobacteria bacterium]|nr:YceI family protein [Acidobacteriota bacterium]